MVRTRSRALIALSAGFLVAAIVGVQLGQSAISEINPIHFQGPAERPIGIDPQAIQPAPDPYAGSYGWDQGQAARAVACAGDCDARQSRDAAILAFAEPVTTRGLSAPYWRDVTPTTELAPWRPGALPNRGLSVERYMHYPVTEEESAEAAAPPAPTPVAAAPAAGAPLPDTDEPLVEE